MIILVATDFPADHETPIDKDNELLNMLRGQLVEKRDLSSKDYVKGTHDLVYCYSQVFLRRTLELFDAAIQENREERSVASVLCARALWENVAAYLDFSNELEAILQNTNAKEVWDWMKNQSQKTRIPEFATPETTAKNIITLIGKLAKVYPVTTTLYDYMSDHAHPGCAGTFAFYAKPASDGIVFSGSAADDVKPLLSASLRILELFATLVVRAEFLATQYLFKHTSEPQTA